MVSATGNGTTAGACAVLDIGKTNVKLALIDAGGATLATERMANASIAAGPYPHHDTERIWNWLLATLKAFAGMATIQSIVPVTHGATAALVDERGLVLPVLDYESVLPQQCDDAYRALRPPFALTFSPALPAGLNLGRQLFWLARTFPRQFGRARHILMYPQYWAWRLSGVAAGEVTSLGCHTDLWQPVTGGYSPLVAAMDWQALMPSMRPAWEPLGPLLPALAAATGLPATCRIVCGIHDSNASLLRYLPQAGTAASADERSASRTVLSTGTWVIAAALGRPLHGLDEHADMLANVNALGQPVVCMRFMGGREFALLAGAAPQVCDTAELQRMIDQGTLALPCFAESGGPFIDRAGAITGPAPRDARQRYALATLYSALMTDYCLERLDAAGSIAVEGSFTDNPHFAPLLAALRAQPVTLSDDASGTTCGGWLLQRRGRATSGADAADAAHVNHAPDAADVPDAAPVTALALKGLDAYRARWLSSLSALPPSPSPSALPLG